MLCGVGLLTGGWYEYRACSGDRASGVAHPGCGWGAGMRILWMVLVAAVAALRSQGPIEFLGEEPAHDLPGTEMSGESGLVQPAVAGGAFAGAPEAAGGHEWSSRAVGGGVNSEVSSALGRAAMLPLVGSEQTTGVSLTGEVVVDPLTGREVPADLNVAAPPVGDVRGSLSDLQPGN